MNIYNKRFLNEMLEEDEISIEEQGFMSGYIEAFKH